MSELPIQVAVAEPPVPTRDEVPYAGTMVYLESTAHPVCDHLGAPLNPGCVAEIGYFSKASMTQPFLGKWTPLIGPSAPEMNRTIDLVRICSVGGRGGAFRWQRMFWHGIEHVPDSQVPLGIRFYDHHELAKARRYNTAANLSWWFRKPKAPKPALVYITLDLEGVLWESGPADAFRTTLACFGSLFTRLMTFGQSLVGERTTA